MNNPKHIFWNGLWRHNIGLVQLLGLCPLLAVSNTLINGLSLGLATLLVLVLTNSLVSLSRGLIRSEIRIPLYVLLIAGLVTLIDLGMQAWFYQLHQRLGIFIPLIVTNCAIIARAESYASKQPPHLAAWDGFSTGLGFLALLIVLSGLRELSGQGSLLSQAELLFGPAASHWTLHISTQQQGFLLMLLPPGAFIALGLLLALRNWLMQTDPGSTRTTI